MCTSACVGWGLTHLSILSQARKARKQQAEENVRAERVAYGGGSDEDDYEEVADDSGACLPSGDPAMAT